MSVVLGTVNIIYYYTVGLYVTCLDQQSLLVIISPARLEELLLSQTAVWKWKTTKAVCFDEKESLCSVLLSWWGKKKIRRVTDVCKRLMMLWIQIHWGGKSVHGWTNWIVWNWRVDKITEALWWKMEVTDLWKESDKYWVKEGTLKKVTFSSHLQQVR